MTFRVTCHHGGATVGEYPTQDAAIVVARAEAKRTGERHDVYPLPSGRRIVSCYPFAELWEADVADLPSSEYVRRHQEAALVGRR
jgi:hypothetical protein